MCLSACAHRSWAFNTNVHFLSKAIGYVLMKKVLRVIGYIFLGAAILLVAANEFIRVTGGPHGEGQGIIAFLVSEKLFVKEKGEKDRNNQNVSSKSHVKWKETEEGNSQYIALSYEAVRKAEAIFSEKTPDNFSSGDLQNVVQALEQALMYAELVPDDVLGRIHSQMNMEFRQNYQTAIDKMLHGFKNRDQKSAIEGSKLYEKYRSWAYSHRQEFSSPIE